MWFIFLSCSVPESSPPIASSLEPEQPALSPGPRQSPADEATTGDPAAAAEPAAGEGAAASRNGAAAPSPERRRSLSLLEPLPADAMGEHRPYAPDGGQPTGVSVALTRKVELTGVWCSEQLLLDDVGTVGCKLAQDHRFGDYLVRRGARVSFWPGSNTLDRFTFFDLEPPMQQLTIGGVPCLNAADLHPTGAVRACVLARDAVVDGAPLEQGSEVYLSHDGTLSSVVVFDTFTLWGVAYGPGTLVMRQGKVEQYLSGQF